MSSGGSGRRHAGQRSLLLAGVLGSFVPGTGHAYAGEPVRGLATLAAYVGGAALLSSARGSLADAGAVALVGAWAVGAVDGARAVRRREARRRASVAPAAGGARLALSVPFPGGH